jgi:hypothetical protein
VEIAESAGLGDSARVPYRTKFRVFSGEAYWAVLDKCYGTSPLREVFREAVNREMDAEIAPLMEQFRRALEVAPASWVQRVQQSKNPLQLVGNDGR